MTADAGYRCWQGRIGSDWMERGYEQMDVDRHFFVDFAEEAHYYQWFPGSYGAKMGLSYRLFLSGR
jgi:hypothetical protein